MHKPSNPMLSLDQYRDQLIISHCETFEHKAQFAIIYVASIISKKLKCVVNARAYSKHVQLNRCNITPRSVERSTDLNKKEAYVRIIIKLNNIICLSKLYVLLPIKIELHSDERAADK
jgi:hypothetical protein